LTVLSKRETKIRIRVEKESSEKVNGAASKYQREEKILKFLIGVKLERWRGVLGR
jgi:hypothetical protein